MFKTFVSLLSGHASYNHILSIFSSNFFYSATMVSRNAPDSYVVRTVPVLLRDVTGLMNSLQNNMQFYDKWGEGGVVGEGGGAGCRRKKEKKTLESLLENLKTL
jgi:hypothetical protein